MKRKTESHLFLEHLIRCGNLELLPTQGILQIYQEGSANVKWNDGLDKTIFASTAFAFNSVYKMNSQVSAHIRLDLLRIMTKQMK